MDDAGSTPGRSGWFANLRASRKIQVGDRDRRAGRGAGGITGLATISDLSSKDLTATAQRSAAELPRMSSELQAAVSRFVC